MYRVTFTSLIAVSLLLVFVHSIPNPGIEDGEVPGVDDGINKPPNRLSASSAIKSTSQFQMNNRVNKPHRPAGINIGGAGGVGRGQFQAGDGEKIVNSGANGGRGGSIKGSGIGGAGGAGEVHVQGGANGVITNSGGNGGDGGSVSDPEPSLPSSQSITNIENSVSANKRDLTASSSIISGPSFPGQNVGGRGGDGHIQIQGGRSNTVSGGNGGPGGNVFASQARFPSSQSTTNIENTVSADKRDFIASSSIVSGPSFPGRNVGGRGGDGSVQIQGGGPNVVSGGNGGAGGSVFGSQPGFQSTTNFENSVSADKRELGSGKNVSRVD